MHIKNTFTLCLRLEIQLKRLEIQLKQEEKSADQDVCPLRHAHIAQEMGKLSFGNIFPAAFKTEGLLFVRLYVISFSFAIKFGFEEFKIQNYEGFQKKKCNKV